MIDVVYYPSCPTSKLYSGQITLNQQSARIKNLKTAYYKITLYPSVSQSFTIRRNNFKFKSSLKKN